MFSEVNESICPPVSSIEKRDLSDHMTVPYGIGLQELAVFEKDFLFSEFQDLFPKTGSIRRCRNYF
jgi:hypothetical protein